MESRNDIALNDWVALTLIALIAMPIAGMFAALFALDVTHSLAAHVATAALLPAAVSALVARRFGASSGIALRLGLLAALLALVLLDLGWSGVPGS